MKLPSRLNSWQVLGILILVAVIIRFPFFFRDYIDRDESTFILMGQALVDGHLPYVKYWDLKPPAVFYFFAGLIALFGKNLVVIRLAGSLVVGFTGWYAFRLSKIFLNNSVSFYAGLLTVYTLSLFGALQGVMSEHLAVLPLIMGVFYLVKNNSIKVVFFAGFLIGLAMMFRLNLAYPLLVVYAYWISCRGFNLRGFKTSIVLVFSTFLAVLLVIFPYIVEGELPLLKKSVIDASLAYSTMDWGKMVETLPMISILLLLAFGAFKFLKRSGDTIAINLIILMVVGQCFMFFKSGKINGHYLLQVLPFVCVLLVGLVSKIAINNSIKSRLIPYVPVLFLLLPTETYLEFANIVKNKIENGQFFNGEGIEIPQYLNNHYSPSVVKNTLFLNEHIGYWFLGAYPPSTIAMHPSNIFRDKIYPFVEGINDNPLKELDSIFHEVKPKFVVLDEDRLPITKTSTEYHFLQNTMASEYILEKSFSADKSVKLYRRKDL